MNRRAVLAGLVLAAACAVVAVLVVREPPSPAASGEAIASRDADAVGTRPASSSAAPVTATLPPRPSADTPMELAATALLARAQAGDALSACRLAEIGLRCRRRTSELEVELLVRRAASGEAQDPEALARKKEAVAECRRLPEGVEPGPLLALAARQGLPEAMLAYATGVHISQAQGFAATPEFDAWLRDAPALLHAARDAGHREAVRHLAEAYTHDLGWPAALIPDDPVQAHAHRRLGSLLIEGGSPDALPETPPLDADQRRAARELSLRLHEQAFGGRRFPATRGSPSPRPGQDREAGFCP